MIFLEKIIDTILPPRCALSGEIVDKQGMLSPDMWGKLNFITDPMCSVCGVPFDFDMEVRCENEEQGVCAPCSKAPPVYQAARSALIYDDGSRDLILSYKHGDQMTHIHTFLPWLARAGGGMLSAADYLIPVPLHRWRLFRRRFNQAALIAAVLGRTVNKPALLDGLERIRATATQGYLRHDERAKNVKRAFRVPPKYQDQLRGKNIVLIDDVYTTGATVQECAKVLLKAGVKRVDVLTLARVVKR
ncbi:MAG: ComF family protein [Alphaproteobacteria bacterium]|nr:ComF family protein [Alphaproteobacteria bacterium]